MNEMIEVEITDSEIGFDDLSSQRMLYEFYEDLKMDAGIEVEMREGCWSSNPLTSWIVCG